VRIKDPPANSMASFKFTSAVPPQGTMFIVDMKLKTLTASFHSDHDEFVDNLDDLSPMAPLRGPRRSLFTMRLHPALQQPCSVWTHSNLRICVANHDSVYAIRPLNLRRPTIPSPSPHWKRTLTIYSESESPKPPHVDGLWVVLVTTV
jgi:hypothetical protein